MSFDGFINPKDGLAYYRMPVGTRVYRGDTNAYREYQETGAVTLTPGRSCFFGLTPESVKQYGITYEFVANKDCLLLAMDDQNVMEFLLNGSSDPKIQRILRENYGYGGGTRNSFAEADNYITAYICSLGYDGYAIMQSRTDFGGSFHKEGMLCNGGNLTFAQLVTSGGEIQPMLDEYASRKAAPQKRRPKRLLESPEGKNPGPGLFGGPSGPGLFGSPSGQSLFGSPSGAASPPPPRKGLFGTSPGVGLFGSPFGEDSPPGKAFQGSLKERVPGRGLFGSEDDVPKFYPKLPSSSSETSKPISLFPDDEKENVRNGGKKTRKYKKTRKHRKHKKTRTHKKTKR